MVYLRLILDKPILGHITFLYFGKIKVNKDTLREYVSKIKPFTLSFKNNDKSGPNKDIPVAVYSSYPNSQPEEVRLQLMKALGSEVMKVNREKWAPHISNPDSANLPLELNVIGIDTDDETFKVIFKKEGETKTYQRTESRSRLGSIPLKVVLPPEVLEQLREETKRARTMVEEQ